MRLQGVSDEVLARRARGGDGVAFAEVAARYGPLIGAACKCPPLDGDREDARQEALIGLFKACVRYDAARGPFPAFARLCVRSRLRSAHAKALTYNNRVLSEAARDGRGPTRLAESIAATEVADPAVVVQLRDRLREHAKHAQRVRALRGNRRPRRRYTPQEISHAVALVAQGKTLTQAARAVGASPTTVSGWLKSAGQPLIAGRRYSPQEIDRALALVQGGASLRQAGAAVGARDSTVLRWLRRAA